MFDAKDLDVIAGALRVAADRYDADAKQARETPSFARIAAHFETQARAARLLLARVEDIRDGDEPFDDGWRRDPGRERFYSDG